MFDISNNTFIYKELVNEYCTQSILFPVKMEKSITHENSSDSRTRNDIRKQIIGENTCRAELAGLSKKSRENDHE